MSNLLLMFIFHSPHFRSGGLRCFFKQEKAYFKINPDEKNND